MVASFAASSVSPTAKHDLDFSRAGAAPAISTNSFTGKGSVNGGATHTVGTGKDFMASAFGIDVGAMNLDLAAGNQTPSAGFKNVQTLNA